MKKTIAILMSALMILLLAAACSNGNDAGKAAGETGDAGKVTLQFFHRWPNEPFNGYFNSVIKEFQDKNPNIKIEVISALNDQYKQKINVVLANENPPDIFFSWAGEYGEKFAREGKALDLTSYYADDKTWSEQIMPSAIEPFTKDGKTFAVPLMVSTKLFYYNKTVFNKLGLQPPATWSQFMQVLTKLKAESGLTPLAVGNKAPWVAGAYMTSLNARLVPGDVLTKDYAAATGEFTHPGYVQAIQKFQELMPYMNDQPNAISFEEERNMFINQQAVISYEETSGFRFFKDLPFEWGFFQMPAIEGGAGDPNIMTGAPEGFMISAKTKHPKEAMAFLKFLTSKENGVKYVKDTNYASAVKGAINAETSPHPLMIEAANKIIEAKSMAQWVDTLMDSRVSQVYLAAMQEVLNNKKTPEQVMKEVQDIAKQVRGK
ncbi:raffinose/stachyose/melibiose transport system substrate-binding protein [Paenibacillus sp. UNCCL117]|uniref:ABC transporter substrate-binding protein n=1 Tax=unclassified Paenibacillus TaxID=185978 RepID=UPI00088B1A35|nr:MULTISPECIES: extracellular solute-binding protein [unclassified Paenibacillus]SDE23118.1 carbohydrate ABC transporter substrate-binding protein, CUT1 family [Paenibacillus sp. cl123]SFW42714.1 raffinose/stachyose/melibiose transport system substrate-binding protein [Paenibacillus sp. UNCCL117]